MDKTEQQLRKVFEELPPKIKEFIRSDEWWRRLNTILPKYQLTAEQIEKVSDEVLLALLGLTDPDDLPTAFQTAAELPVEKAGELALALETAVFAPINEQLSELDPISIDDYRAGLSEMNVALAKLPADLREIILSTDTADYIQNIGKKYNLRIDQMGGLDDEVGAVLVGETRSEEFIDKIKDRLQIDQATASAIAQEVNEQIFVKIREALRNLPSSATPEASQDQNAPPVVAAPDTKTIFEEKMGKLFRIPREEVDLSEGKASQTKDPYSEALD